MKVNQIQGDFKGLRDIQKRFNDRIHEHLTKTYSLAKEKPQLLVAVMRIFNNEELTYRELVEKKKALMEENAKQIPEREEKEEENQEFEFGEDDANDDCTLEISEYMILDVL
jgi:hypothetical protein